MIFIYKHKNILDLESYQYIDKLYIKVTKLVENPIKISSDLETNVSIINGYKIDFKDSYEQNDFFEDLELCIKTFNEVKENECQV